MITRLRRKPPRSNAFRKRKVCSFNQSGPSDANCTLEEIASSIVSGEGQFRDGRSLVLYQDPLSNNQLQLVGSGTSCSERPRKRLKPSLLEGPVTVRSDSLQPFDVSGIAPSILEQAREVEEQLNLFSGGIPDQDSVIDDGTIETFDVSGMFSGRVSDPDVGPVIDQDGSVLFKDDIPSLEFPTYGNTLHFDDLPFKPIDTSVHMDVESNSILKKSRDSAVPGSIAIPIEVPCNSRKKYKRRCNCKKCDSGCDCKQTKKERKKKVFREKKEKKEGGVIVINQCCE